MCLLECETWAGFLWMGINSYETKEKKDAKLSGKPVTHPWLPLLKEPPQPESNKPLGLSL